MTLVTRVIRVQLLNCVKSILKIRMLNGDTVMRTFQYILLVLLLLLSVKIHSATVLNITPNTIDKGGVYYLTMNIDTPEFLEDFTFIEVAYPVDSTFEHRINAFEITLQNPTTFGGSTASNSVSFGMYIPENFPAGSYHIKVSGGLNQKFENAFTVSDVIRTDLNKIPFIEPTNLVMHNGPPQVNLDVNSQSDTLLFTYEDDVTLLENLHVVVYGSPDSLDAPAIAFEESIGIETFEYGLGEIGVVVSASALEGESWVTIEINDDDTTAKGQSNFSFRVMVGDADVDVGDTNVVETDTNDVDPYANDPCGGIFCLQKADIINDGPESALMLQFNKQVEAVGDSIPVELFILDNDKGPDEGDTEPQFNTENIVNSVIIQMPVPDTATKELFYLIPLEQMKKIISFYGGNGKDLFLKVPAGVIKNGSYDPQVGDVPVNNVFMENIHPSMGSILEVIGAGYQPAFNLLTLRLDGPIDTTLVKGSVIHIGTGVGDAVSVTLDSILFSTHTDSYGTADSAAQEITLAFGMHVFVNPEEALALERIPVRGSGLHLDVPDSTWTSVEGEPYNVKAPLGYSRFENKIPVSYGGWDYAENFIDSATYVGGEQFITVYLNQPVRGKGRGTFEEDQGAFTESNIVFAVDLDPYEFDMFSEDKGTEPDFENDDRFLTVPYSQIEVLSVQSQVKIPVSEKMLERFNTWKVDRPYAYFKDMTIHFDQNILAFTDGTENHDVNFNVVVYDEPFSPEITVRGGAIEVKFEAGDERSAENGLYSYVLMQGDSVIASDDEFDKTIKLLYPLPNGEYRLQAAGASVDFTESEGLALDTTIVIQPVTEITVIPNMWTMHSFGFSASPIAIVGDSTSLFNWNDELSYDPLFGKYEGREEISEFKPALSYWIFSETEVVVPVPQMDSVIEPVEVTLHYGEDGWNQVANPYNYPIPTTAFGSEREFFKWDGLNYRLVSVLKPYVGYWMLVNAGEEVAVDMLPSFSDVEYVEGGLLMKGAVNNSADWKVSLALQTKDGAYADGTNGFGVTPLSENALDETDRSELPASPGDGVYVSFTQNGKILREEYKSAIDASAVWNLEMGSTFNTAVDAELTLEGLESLNALGYILFLSDGNTTREVTTTTTDISLQPSAKYSLIVSDGSTDVAQLANPKHSVTHFPRVVSNYVQFEVSSGAFGEASAVRLMVYDVSGALVAQEQFSSMNNLRWNIPEAVSMNSGIFYYELHSNTQVLKNHMLVMD